VGFSQTKTSRPLRRSSGGGADEFVRFGESPDSLLLVVAGAYNAGISTVVPTVRALFHSQAIEEGETAPAPV
jgi:hypothetical protein